MTAEPTFFEIRNRIMAWDGLSLSTRVLWEHLCQMAWADGSCYPSNQTLAKILGISLRQVIESKNELTAKKLIHVFHRNRPQTTLIFPFVQFKNIEQRDKNIITLNSAVSALPEPTNINNLSLDSAEIAFDQCSECTTDSAVSAPIKENIKRKNKSTKKKNGIEPYAVGNGIDTIHLAVASQPEVAKKPKTTKHKASREEQLDKIKANLDDYKTQYPEIDINLEIENFEYWLANYPKGKMRKDLFATWKNWLHREHVQQAKRKKQPLNKINKREFDPEEFNRYVSEFNG